jgi:hypothetical protein
MGRHEVLSVVFSIENNALLPGKKITLNIAIKRSFLSRAGRSKIEATHNFATDLWRRKFGKFASRANFLLIAVKSSDE